jgi:hypothetical protein
MLRLLTDEQISYVVAEQVKAKRPDIVIESVRTWQGGAFQGTDDAVLLEAAALAGWTLVTYDRKTIPPVLLEWGALGRRHGGVIFSDDRTVAPNDIGGLVRALILHWDRTRDWDWGDRVDFLQRPPHAGAGAE